MSTPESSARTRMFARVIGPFLVIATIAAVVRAPELFAHVSDVTASPLWTWTAGAFTLLAGLVVVALHPYWRGAAASIVSATGWVATVKGVFLVAFPATIASVADAAADWISWWRGVYLLFALAGLYLTYAGWAPAPSRPAAQVSDAKPDLPRAA